MLVCIQSSSRENGPSEYTRTHPSTPTRNSSASSRSGTVKPMCSAPRSPGRPLTRTSYLIESNKTTSLGLGQRFLAESIEIGFNPAYASGHAETPPFGHRDRLGRALDDRRRLEGGGSRAPGHDAHPTAPHPRLRGDGA